MSSVGEALCGDCPPVGYPTDKTRCTSCPRRQDGNTPERNADEMAPVIQADRDAAAELLAYHDEPTSTLYAITTGISDGHPYVKAFARHRLATLESSPADGAGGATPAEVDIPADLAKLLVELGPVEWGQTEAFDAAGHGAHIIDSVDKTAANFAQEGAQHMHGLYLAGTGTVVCHTGTSPNSPNIARALTGAWNWLLEISALTPTETGEVGK